MEKASDCTPTVAGTARTVECLFTLWQEISKFRQPTLPSVLPQGACKIAASVLIRGAMDNQTNHTERRDFLKAAMGAAITTGFPAIVAAQTVTNDIKVDLVGCRGRV